MQRRDLEAFGREKIFEGQISSRGCVARGDASRRWGPGEGTRSTSVLPTVGEPHLRRSTTSGGHEGKRSSFQETALRRHAERTPVTGRHGKSEQKRRPVTVRSPS